MFVLKRSANTVLFCCWLLCWATALGLNGWRWEPFRSPIVPILLAAPFGLAATVTLTVLLSTSARRIFAAGATDWERMKWPLWGYFAVSALAGLVLLVSAANA